jgi:hypothetical protein
VGESLEILRVDGQEDAARQHAHLGILVAVKIDPASLGDEPRPETLRDVPLVRNGLG